jgi:hypothetical protein
MIEDEDDDENETDSNRHGRSITKDWDRMPRSAP